MDEDLSKPFDLWLVPGGEFFGYKGGLMQIHPLRSGCQTPHTHRRVLMGLPPIEEANNPASKLPPLHKLRRAVLFERQEGDACGYSGVD